MKTQPKTQPIPARWIMSQPVLPPKKQCPRCGFRDWATWCRFCNVAMLNHFNPGHDFVSSEERMKQFKGVR